MCAAWKKKNERNEIVCFYCTQSDILLCDIARFSRGNKNKLRTFQPQKWKKIKNSQLQTKFTCSYKKKSALSIFPTNVFRRSFLSLLLLSLLNYVPFVPTCFTYLTCLCALRAYLPSCLKLIRAYVPTCLRAYGSTCLRALIFHMPTCLHFSRAYVPTTTHKIYWGSLLYLALLFFSGLFAEAATGGVL